MLPLIKCIHLLAGTTFFGLSIAGFFYITHAARTQQRPLFSYALKASFYSDALVIFIIPIQFGSGYWLVHKEYLAPTTPWIVMAYIAFSCVAVLWLLILIMKYKLYREIIKQQGTKTALGVTYYLTNTLMLFIFMLIIHDAVMKNTYFAFLFK